MSHPPSADAHGSHDDDHGFHPHILPLKVYMAVGGSLFVLTGITVWVAQYHLGSAGNLIVAMTVATIKASLVALFFMHLLYDNKLYLTIFLSSLLFLSIFIVFTLFDLQRRGDIYDYHAIQREHPPVEGLLHAQPAAPAAAPAEGAAPAAAPAEGAAPAAAPAEGTAPAEGAAPAAAPAEGAAPAPAPAPAH